MTISQLSETESTLFCPFLSLIFHSLFYPYNNSPCISHKTPVKVLISFVLVSVSFSGFDKLFFYASCSKDSIPQGLSLWNMAAVHSVEMLA